MIDIHCHILYDVDDGSENEETSLRLVDHMAGMEITDIIVTPHYRRGMFAYPKEKIETAFRHVSDYAAGLGIRVYPGCEYHVDHDIFRNLGSGRVHSMADSSYVLTEYSYGDSFDRIFRYTQDLVMRGWIPIIAHIERYEIFQKKPALAGDLIDAGAKIQVNADSVLGLDGRLLKKVTKKMLKDDLVDYIASDAHNLDDRSSHMDRCRAYVARRYGEETAQQLFEDNQRRLLREALRLRP